MGRCFGLHHLRKKIPRRRAQLRGAKARTVRYMRWLFSQKKDSIPLLLKYFGSLTTRWRADPPADFVRQKHPPRQDPLWETSSPVWRLRLPDPRKQSFSSPGCPPSWRRSFPRLERATMGARVRPYYPPGIFLQGLRARCDLKHLFQYRIFQTLGEGGQTPNHLRLC